MTNNSFHDRPLKSKAHVIVMLFDRIVWNWRRRQSGSQFCRFLIVSIRMNGQRRVSASNWISAQLHNRARRIASDSANQSPSWFQLVLLWMRFECRRLVSTESDDGCVDCGRCFGSWFGRWPRIGRNLCWQAVDRVSSDDFRINAILFAAVVAGRNRTRSHSWSCAKMISATRPSTYDVKTGKCQACNKWDRQSASFEIESKSLLLQIVWCKHFVSSELWSILLQRVSKKWKSKSKRKRQKVRQKERQEREKRKNDKKRTDRLTAKFRTG